MSKVHLGPQVKSHLEITGFDGEVVVYDCLKCCHCGHVWKVVPGSGKVRGRCMKCNDFTCGRPECDPCYPLEKKLDDIEKGRLLEIP